MAWWSASLMARLKDSDLFFEDMGGEISSPGKWAFLDELVRAGDFGLRLTADFGQDRLIQVAFARQESTQAGDGVFFSPASNLLLRTDIRPRPLDAIIWADMPPLPVG